MLHGHTTKISQVYSMYPASKTLFISPLEGLPINSLSLCNRILSLKTISQFTSCMKMLITLSAALIFEPSEMYIAYRIYFVS